MKKRLKNKYIIYNIDDLQHGNAVETEEGYICIFIKKRIFTQNNFFDCFVNLTKPGFVNAKKFGLIGDTFKDSICGKDIVKVYKDYTLKEVLWERTERIILTEEEKIILKNIDKQYKYIARDSNGKLYTYTTKPKKDEFVWRNANGERFLFNNLFQFIKWKDKEPYLIEDLLKE